MFLSLIKRVQFALRLFSLLVLSLNSTTTNSKNLKEQIIVVGPKSLGLSVVTAVFIGAVFTLQIVKEFLYLDISSFIGAILSIAFVRELSPVFTAIILSSRIGSSFTAELAVMKVTEQIDALYLLKTDPIVYLVWPRLLACVFMLPFLNLFFLLTSIFTGLFISFILYSVPPPIFLVSSFASLSFQDFLKSIFKSMIFGLILSTVSCAWGLTARGGSKNVGRSTTSAVVTVLLLIFIVDCLLTYLMFHQADSVLRFL